MGPFDQVNLKAVGLAVLTVAGLFLVVFGVLRLVVYIFLG